MTRTEKGPLLGSEVVQLLLPHRRPMLMVDDIVSFERGSPPRLHAHRMVTANDPVFSGHFPGIHIWPGVLTVEGLGQSCLLLSILDALDDDALDALSNLHRGYRLHPGFRPGDTPALLERLGSVESRMGFGAAADVRFLAPVFAGQRIDYRVSRTHTMEGMSRFDVEADVAGEPVVRGTMTGKSGAVLPTLL